MEIMNKLPYDLQEKIYKKLKRDDKKRLNKIKTLITDPIFEKYEKIEEIIDYFTNTYNVIDMIFDGACCIVELIEEKEEEMYSLPIWQIERMYEAYQELGVEFDDYTLEHITEMAHNMIKWRLEIEEEVGTPEFIEKLRELYQQPREKDIIEALFRNRFRTYYGETIMKVLKPLLRFQNIEEKVEKLKQCGFSETEIQILRNKMEEEHDGYLHELGFSAVGNQMYDMEDNEFVLEFNEDFELVLNYT